MTTDKFVAKTKRKDITQGPRSVIAKLEGARQLGRVPVKPRWHEDFVMSK